MSFLDDARAVAERTAQEFRDFLDSHAPQLEHDASVAAAIASDPLTQAAMTAAGIPAPVREAIAGVVSKLDAEFTAAVQAATENGKAAGHQAALDEMAAAPADAEPPAEAELPPADPEAAAG